MILVSYCQLLISQFFFEKPPCFRNLTKSTKLYQMRNLKLILTVALFCSYGITRAQCSGIPCSSLVPPAPVLTCNPATQTLLTNNAVIDSGQTYYYQGGMATFSGVNINGGTLIICQGPVTFDGFSFETGNIIIAAGAIVNFTNYYNAGPNAHYFYNYGTVNFNIDINVQGTSTHMVYNGPGGVINTTGRMDIVNGGLVVNDGIINVAGEIRIQGNGQACLGNDSQVNTQNLWVDNTNPVSVPVGAACVSYNSQMQGNGSLTNSPCLILCQSPGASPPVNPSSIGSAALMTNCIGCSATPLAVKLVSFDLSETDEGIFIKWIAEPETAANKFILERATTVNMYEQLVVMEASSGSGSQEEVHYSFLDYGPFSGSINYYRLSEEDGNGIRKEVVVKTIELKKANEPAIYPNPCLLGENIQIQYKPKKNRDTQMEIHSVRGVLIRHEELIENESTHYVTLPRGCFMIYILENGKMISVNRIMVI